MIDNVPELTRVTELKRAGVEHATMDLGHLKQMWWDVWDCRPPRFTIGGIEYDTDAIEVSSFNEVNRIASDDHVQEGRDRFNEWGKLDDPQEDNPRKEALGSG